MTESKTTKFISEFKDMSDKYDEFIKPSYDISIDGTSITKDKNNIKEIKVELSVRGIAGIGTFIIGDCYDSKKRSFNSEIISKLKLGKKVSISLGYSDKNTEIFVGYIESINFEFNQDEAPSISIVCMDVIHILMQNQAVEQKGNEKALSDIVTVLINKQKSFAKIGQIDSITVSGTQIVQNVSDYEFIKKAADANGYEFFVSAGKVYFRKAKNEVEPITTLVYGESVISFNREIKYKNVEVTVMGKDDLKKKTTKGAEKGQTESPYMSTAFTSNKIIHSGNLNTDEKAKTRAKSEVNKILETAYDGNIECIGIPEIIAGRYIKISGFDNTIDGKYYISDVSHQLKSGKYTALLRLTTNG